MEIVEISGRRQVVHGFHGQRKEGVGIKPLPVAKAIEQASKVLIDEARLLASLLDDQADEPASCPRQRLRQCAGLRRRSRWRRRWGRWRGSC